MNLEYCSRECVIDVTNIMIRNKCMEQLGDDDGLWYINGKIYKSIDDVVPFKCAVHKDIYFLIIKPTNVAFHFQDGRAVSIQTLNPIETCIEHEVLLEEL